MDSTHTPPDTVDGTPVEAYIDSPTDAAGETWITLVPEGDDERLWEFSLTTGRIVRTM